jgi:hypothetical protein
MRIKGFCLAFLISLFPTLLSGASRPTRDIALSARISDCSEAYINIDVSVKNNAYESVVLRKSFLKIENIQLKISGTGDGTGKKRGGKIDFQEYDGESPNGNLEITVAPNELFGKCVSLSTSKMLLEATKEKGRIELQTSLEIANRDSSSWDTLAIHAMVEGICK